MSTSEEPNPKQNELSSQAGQAKSAAVVPTSKEIGSWDEKKLLEWIQQNLTNSLDDEDKGQLSKPK